MSTPIRKKVVLSYAHRDTDFAWSLVDKLG